MSTTEAQPYSSAAALRAANAQLGELRRSEGVGDTFYAAIEEFLARSSATGALLAEEDDRWSAQGLLDYWASALERLGRPAPEATLAEFDPLLAPELPEDACPYLGLDAFDERDAGLFFGRRRVMETLVERLRDHRLVAVVGPSGSGKSSLVRAGLLPALRGDAIPGSAEWTILPPMVPGSDPLAALDRTQAAGGRWQETGSESSQEAGGRWQETGSESSQGGSADQPPPPASSLLPPGSCLLIIDQFEEAFTLCSDETRRRAFLDRMVAWATDAAGGRVVLTMRSDFEPFISRAEALQPLFEAGRWCCRR